MGTFRAAKGSLRVKLRRSDGQRLDASSVWNISLGGLFIEMVDPLAFGEDLQLEFEIVGQSLPLVCTGFVVWSTKDSPEKGAGKHGIGIRLTEVGIAEMRTIASGVGQELNHG